MFSALGGGGGRRQHGQEDSGGADGATTGLWAPKCGLMSRKAKLLGAGAESQTNQRTTLWPSGPVLRCSWDSGSHLSVFFLFCPARVFRATG